MTEEWTLERYRSEVQRLKKHLEARHATEERWITHPDGSQSLYLPISKLTITFHKEKQDDND